MNITGEVLNVLKETDYEHPLSAEDIAGLVFTSPHYVYECIRKLKGGGWPIEVKRLYRENSSCRGYYLDESLSPADVTSIYHAIAVCSEFPDEYKKQLQQKLMAMTRKK